MWNLGMAWWEHSAFIPCGTSWGGLKDSWALTYWGSSDTSSFSVNSEDLVISHLVFLPLSSPTHFQTWLVLTNMRFPGLAILGNLKTCISHASFPFPKLSPMHSWRLSQSTTSSWKPPLILPIHTSVCIQFALGTSSVGSHSTCVSLLQSTCPSVMYCPFHFPVPPT